MPRSQRCNFTKDATLQKIFTKDATFTKDAAFTKDATLQKMQLYKRCQLTKDATLQKMQLYKRFHDYKIFPSPNDAWRKSVYKRSFSKNECFVPSDLVPTRR